MQPWTKQRLHELVAQRLKGLKFIVVSNREPVVHVASEDGSVKCLTPASGLTSAIDPIIRTAGGVWVAHGSGDADARVVDGKGRVQVPPRAPEYTLRRVWLPKELEVGYYYGLSNEGLWPLCHIVFQRPQFRSTDWCCYRHANELFAEAVLDEAGDAPAFVFVQDYHLGLLPKMLKDRRPDLAVAHFWHIPWPNRETFRTFPWKEELLEGLLANDLLGFHLRYHCANFLDTIDRNIEALVDMEHARVIRSGHVTTVRPFPISIDFAEYTEAARSASMGPATDEWLRHIGEHPEFLGIGVDRADYTKGIPERLAAVDLLLQEHPEYIGRFKFVQVAVPSRVRVPDYSRVNQLIADTAENVNRKWGRGDWHPVVLIQRHIEPKDLIALYLLSNFCVVSSLHDGMNLVAKEFVASRIDGDGVLILSAFTGAARELIGARVVNPFALDEIATAMHAALQMPPTERHRRMRKMRGAVAYNNIYRWAAKVVNTFSGMELADSADPLVAASENFETAVP
jgi:trehalose-6-phosphate synthase